MNWEILVVGGATLISLFFMLHNPLSKIENRLTSIEDELKAMNGFLSVLFTTFLFTFNPFVLT